MSWCICCTQTHTLKENLIIDYWLWLVCLRAYVVCCTQTHTWEHSLKCLLSTMVFTDEWTVVMVWKYHMKSVFFFIIYIIFTGERHCVGPMVAGLRACRHICWKTPSELVQYHQKTNNIVSRVLYNTAADGDRFFALNEIMFYFWNIHRKNWNIKEWELTLVPHSQRHQDRKNSPSKKYFREWNNFINCPDGTVAQKWSLDVVVK